MNHDEIEKTTSGGILGTATNTKVLIVSLLAWTLTNMDQAFFAYAIPGILEEFQLPLEAVGIILTISFVLSSILLLFVGQAVDRFGRGPMLCFYLSVSALLVGLQGFAGGVVMLTLFRAFGFGISSGLSPITNAYVAENVVPRIRGLAMGVLQCGYPLGWFLASIFAVPLLASHGWRAMFFAAFLVIPIAGLFYWMLRNIPDVKPPANDGKTPHALKVLFSPEHRRKSVASITTYFAFGGAYAGSAFYFPTYFTDVRGYTPSEAADLVGMSNGIGIIGYLVAAFVGEYLLTRRNVFVIWALGGALALTGLMWVAETRLEDTIWYAATAALFYGSLAVLPVLIAEIFPQEVRVSALSACASAPLSLGFAVFPMVVPFVVGLVGWQLGFTVIICPLLVVSVIAAMFLPNRKSGMGIA
ncbi:MAG: MFS family permease [Alcanivorax sp.]|jgi:MFS family permease